MIKVVDRATLAELLVEADVVLRASSFKTSLQKKFEKKKDEKDDDDDDDDENDDEEEALVEEERGGSTTKSGRENTTNTNGGGRPVLGGGGGGGEGFFSSTATKRLHGAYLSFCSDATREKQGTTTTTIQKTTIHHRTKMMNSKDWLALVTESNLLSKSFSARRAMRCFEDASERDDDDGDGMSRVSFEQFLRLLADDVAKAYDVEAKVVGKRVVATAYAIERRKEEEERRKGGKCDDDDDAGTDDEKHANAYASRQRMMTTPLSTTFSKSANGSTSSWRVRAERHANRYGRITDDHVVAATTRRKKSDAAICDDYDDNNNLEYRFADDTKIEDRVANAFETVLCQSSESSRSTISEREFIKICIACALIGNGFTKSDCLDIAFSISGAPETGEIDRRAFVRGLRKIALVHDVPFSDVGKRVLAVSRAL